MFSNATTSAWLMTGVTPCDVHLLIASFLASFLIAQDRHVGIVVAARAALARHWAAQAHPQAHVATIHAAAGGARQWGQQHEQVDLAIVVARVVPASPSGPYS